MIDTKCLWFSNFVNFVCVTWKVGLLKVAYEPSGSFLDLGFTIEMKRKYQNVDQNQGHNLLDGGTSVNVVYGMYYPNGLLFWRKSLNVSPVFSKKIPEHESIFWSQIFWCLHIVNISLGPKLTFFLPQSSQRTNVTTPLTMVTETWLKVGVYWFSVWSGSSFRQTHCVVLTLSDNENHWLLSYIQRHTLVRPLLCCL